MIHYKEDLAELLNLASLVSAEEVVLKREPHWRAVIDEAYKVEPLRTIIEKEKMGIEQIKNGMYKFRQ